MPEGDSCPNCSGVGWYYEGRGANRRQRDCILCQDQLPGMQLEPLPPVTPRRTINPLVKQMFDLMDDLGTTKASVARESGYNRSEFYRWAAGSTPNLAQFSDILSVLGYRIVIEANEPK